MNEYLTVKYDELAYSRQHGLKALEAVTIEAINKSIAYHKMNDVQLKLF